MKPIHFKFLETAGLVTVIIPAYRSEQFISATLDSVRSQRYPHWEVVVVDDDPAGGCRAIVEDFAQRNPDYRISYQCNSHNLGPSETRNIAFAMARGEYVALLDSDDLWLPEHLTRSVAAFRETDTDIVYSSVVMFEDQSDLLLGIWGPHQEELNDFPNGLFRRTFVTPSATVMRRSVLADVGGWDVHLRYCEDINYWLRCVATNKKFKHVGGCQCLYRKNHSGAATQKMCAVLDHFGGVVEQFLDIPGIRKKSCRNFVSRAYAMAAQQHARAMPEYDPSADRTRIAPNYYRAWQFRRKRIDHLLRSGLYALRYNLFTRSTSRGLPSVPQSLILPLPKNGASAGASRAA
jgi:glycosyltransferase involved in cell wall biosynthesis